MRAVTTHSIFWLAVLALLLPLGLLGCSDEPGTGGNENIITDDGDDDGDREPDETGYTAGPLDGSWTLSWKVNGETFSEFEVEHNLDEERLSIQFNSVGGNGSGPVSAANWRDDQFTAQWEPYANNPIEVYSIVQSAFVEDRDDRIEGLIGGATFDFREFVMERD